MLFVAFLPVIIPLRCPVNDDVAPSPGIVTPLKDTVIPNPTVAAVTAAAGTVSIWSAKASIVHTFKFSAQDPGFLEP